ACLGDPGFGHTIEMKVDCSAAGGGDAHDHANGRRLSRAARSGETHDLAPVHFQRHFVDGPARSVLFHDAVDGENAIDLPAGTSPHRVRTSRYPTPIPPSREAEFAICAHRSLPSQA